MKNNFDSIPIPEKLNEVVSNSMIEVEKIQKKKKVRKMTLCISTAAAIVISMTVCVTNPALASRIPIIGRIFANIEKDISFSGDYSSKAQNTCYVASDNGIEMTAKEIYCDGSSVYISFLVKNSQSFGEIASFYSDAEGSSTHQFLYNLGSWKIEKNGKQQVFMNNHIEGRQVDENTFEGMIKLDLVTFQNKVPDSFDMYLSFNQIGVDQIDQETNLISSMSKTDGEWNCILPVTVDRENVQTIDLNDKNKSGYGIKNLVVTPYEVKVEAIIPSRELSEEEIQMYYRKFKEASEMRIANGKEPIDIDQEMESIPKNRLLEYAVSVFDQDGKRLNFSEMNGTNNVFAVRGKKLTKLFIYIGTNGIDTLKEDDQKVMDKKAVYRKEIDLK